MPNLKALLDAIPLPDEEPFPGETLLADGWQYHDLDRQTPEAIVAFRAIVGEENLRWLSFANYGSSQRGQVLISPTGLANCRAYLKKQ